MRVSGQWEQGLRGSMCLLFLMIIPVSMGVSVPANALTARSRVRAQPQESRRLSYKRFISRADLPRSDSALSRAPRVNISGNAREGAAGKSAERLNKALVSVDITPSSTSKRTTSKGQMTQDVKAAGILASSAVIFEAVQLAGTALMGYLIHLGLPEASDFREALVMLAGNFQSMGPTGYLAYMGVQILLQVFPIASAFAMTVSAGFVFGSIVKGVAVVSIASTTSAAISFLLCRMFAEGRGKEFKEKSQQITAIDTALADAGFLNSVLLMTLLRSSPIIPFSWANYLFGLSRVSLLPFVLGTFFGTLPGISLMVNAGMLGGEVLEGESSIAAQAGIISTILIAVLVGRISDSALKKLDIDLEEPKK